MLFTIHVLELERLKSYPVLYVGDAEQAKAWMLSLASDFGRQWQYTTRWEGDKLIVQRPLEDGGMHTLIYSCSENGS